MKEKIELLIEIGISKKKIADILGIAPTNITRLLNHNIPISTRHERKLDEYMIDIQNKMLKALTK